MRRRELISGAAALAAFSLLHDQARAFGFGPRPGRYPLRQPNLIAALGDSRVAQIHLDAAHLNISNANVFGWAKAISGQRVTLAYNGGVSGNRSDQMLARVGDMLQTLAGTAYIHIGVNDISQAATGFTSTAGPMAGQAISTSNVALHVYLNILWAYSTLMNAGYQNVIVVLEPGASNLGAASVAQVVELNQRLRDWAETAPGAIPFDLPYLIWNPTSSGTAIAFKSNYMRSAGSDTTHLGAKGAYAAAADATHGLAQLFTQMFPRFPRELRNINEIASANSNVNQMANPMFITTTGGVAGGGVTGSVPSGWTVTRVTDQGSGGGTQTCAVSTGTPADGSPGNEVILAMTFAAAGDSFSLVQDWTLANWSQGDIIQGGAEVSIDDATNLAGAYAYLQANGTGASPLTTMDLANIENVSFTTGALKIPLLTEKMTIPQFTTKSWVTQHYSFIASAASTVTVRIRRGMSKRRFN